MHRFNRCDLRSFNHQAVQYTDFACDAFDGKAVTAVRCQVDINRNVVQPEIISKLPTYRGIFRQLHQTIMVFRQAQFGFRTQHAFGWLATKLCFLYLEVTRQHCAYYGEGHFEAIPDIRSTTNHLYRLVPIINLTDPELVRIRMGRYGDDFTHHNATELAGYRLESVNFQTCHGDLVHQCLGVIRRIDPFP